MESNVMADRGGGKADKRILIATGASDWGGPLLGVQKANVFTAPRMRLLQ